MSALRGEAWHALARACRGVLVASWAADLPPWQVLQLLGALGGGQGGGHWVALTSLRRCPLPAMRATSVSAVTTPFLSCPCHFDLSGFVLSFEVEEGEEEAVEEKTGCAPQDAAMGNGAGLGRFWVRFSSPACGPMSIRVLLALQDGDGGDASIVDLRLELRADGCFGLRLDGFGDAAALAGLRAAIRHGELSAAILVAPVWEADGHPGGSGWIPWRPAKPSVAFL